MSIWNDLPDVRRIPIIGDDVYQAGQVYDIIAQPCSPNPTITVKAFFAYAPTLFWALLKPTAVDAVQARFHRSHKRKTYKKLTIFGGTQLALPDGPGVHTVLFNAFDLIERVGWYILIADATTDFALNWTSLAYQWSGCNVEGAKWAMLSGGTQGYVEPWVAQPHQVSFDVGQTWNNPNASKSIAQISDTGAYNVSFTGTPDMKPYLGITGQITKVELVVVEFPGQTYRVQGAPMDEAQPNGAWTVTETRWDTNPKLVRAWIEVSWSAGRMRLKDCVLNLSGSNSAGLTWDP